MEEDLERQRSSQASGQQQIGKINEQQDCHPGWPAANKQRKSLLGCLVEKVAFDRGEHDITKVRIVWRGGALSELEVKMRVSAIADLANARQMRERALELARARTPDNEIAAVLTGEGHRSPTCVEKVLPITVQPYVLASSEPGGSTRPSC